MADPVLLVLPGSRASEVKRLLGPFEEAIALLKAAGATTTCSEGRAPWRGLTPPWPAAVR